MAGKQDNGKAGSGRKWYLKKPDGSIYGPETVSELHGWAAECRIVAGNEVSDDRKHWIPAEHLPQLKMDWVAELQNGKKYGPFNIGAAPALHEHGVFPDGTRLANKTTGERITLDELLKRGAATRKKKDAAQPQPAPESADAVREEPSKPKSGDASTAAKEAKPARSKSKEADGVDAAALLELQAKLKTEQSEHKKTQKKHQAELKKRDGELAALRAESEERVAKLEKEQQRSRRENAKVASEREKLQAERDRIAGELARKRTEREQHVTFAQSELATAHARSKLLGRTCIVLAVLLAHSLLCLFFVRGCSRGDEDTAVQESTEASADQVAGAQPEVEIPEPEPAVAREEDVVAPPVDRIPSRPDWPVFEAAGVRFGRGAKAYTMVFDKPVFSRMVTPTPESVKALQVLADQFRDHMTGHVLIIEGHTDNSPLGSGGRYANNYDLGMARARKVFEVLNTKCGMPATFMRVTSAGEKNPPFSNATAESRKKNRTVVLKLQKK